MSRISDHSNHEDLMRTDADTRDVDLGTVAGGVELAAATGLSEAMVGRNLSKPGAPPAKELGRRRVWWYADALAWLQNRRNEYLAEQAWERWRPAPDVAGLAEVIAQIPWLQEQKASKTRAIERLGRRDAPEGILLASGRVWLNNGAEAVRFLKLRQSSRYGEPEERTD
jgi:predicted DNA-binding transcriptional regulator AlpA